MGVPALFRFLSKKYPKIVSSVVEEHSVFIESADGSKTEIPVDMSGANPNGVETDYLYLDFNGIVHPCTHPEGKEAPKNEEDMMHEIFIYTDRVVNMARPRKLLMIAIDGVAPRAKMNQQRSRRFRAAQEAEVKEEERIKAIAEWELLGKEVSDEFRENKGWDSNAITPGTPFMDLLARSLRYWVAKKLNEDPGWAGLEVIISDSSVPGEGEHKIMDFIRRQRTQPAYDPNTSHVIYGLDADLIMLSLATHEPHFRVLREDVFAQDKKGRGCHTCGQPGHHSSQCTGKAKEKQGIADVVAKTEVKPFIFLDVAVLREYLAVELSAPIHSFPFSLERAIDDWVFLIFFVGNDFLPHLPSLEIREGAIETLMGIWKSSLDRMGGYLAENGKVNLSRAQIILQGLADREDEIFRRRRETEERQDKGDKRRRIEAEHRTGGTHLQNGHDYVSVQKLPVPHSAGPILPHVLPASSSLAAGPSSLPARPSWVATPEDPVIKLEQIASMVGGSNSSIVANRVAIRMANLNAAQMLKAELDGSSMIATPVVVDKTAVASNMSAAERLRLEMMGGVESSSEVTEVEDVVKVEDVVELSPAGVKRKAEEDLVKEVVEGVDVEVAIEADEEDDEEDESEEDAPVGAILPVVLPGGHAGTPQLVLMGNNVAEQEDIVKLWEPGYKERYYRQKFGAELGDTTFRNEVVKCYVEGLCWVLEYYFQGAPSWQWYYPYHFSPFASDFTDLGDLDITFDLGAPVQPYEQLMSVFPSASRIHLPEPFHKLMADDDSPIKDFYPLEFQIDMNGKKMLWQGVALLPFVDAQRLKEQMRIVSTDLSDDEVSRNTLGTDTIFVGKDHQLYDYIEGLYTKRKVTEPIPLDTKRSKGMAGFVLPDPACIPGATFDSPLPSLSDIYNDQSISATFSFPPQATPHRSILLPGVRRAATTLSSYDKDNVRRGGGDRENNGFSGNQRSNPDRGPGFAKLDNRGGRGGYQGNQGNGGGAGGYQGGRYEQSQQQQPQSRDAYSGYGQGAPAYGSNGSYNPRGGPPPVPSFPGKYGYQPAPNPSDQGGYRPPTNNGYAAAPPANARYSSGPQLYGAANLGASQGQYGYSAPPSPPPAANGNGSRAPPYSGYGGYTGTQAPQQPRRY